ncbi:MAG: restriction endonuclease subunit S [Alistipes sp.]|nr:restriction endonuclease subunit S [Alistipes sp.]
MTREMKDSGIPWIREIPKDWTIELIGNQVKEVNNPNTNGLEDNALQFKMGSIISKSRGDSKYNPETLEGYNIVDKGVIMLNGLNLSFDLISQRVGLVRERGVITSTYLAVKPSNNIDSEYLTYLFKAYDNCKAFHSMGRGLRQTLSYGELRKYLLLYPSLAEQQRIAEFLDRKCGEVDEMIGLQEQIIEELKAYKQSVITEAVTKGLNPAAPMRDSGIEWIGSIPEHWEVHRIKNHFSIISGSGFDVNLQGLEDGELPICKASDISRADKVLYAAENYLSREVALSQKFNIIPIGSIIFPKIGEAMKKNRRAICAVECCVDNNCQALVPNGINNIYSYYLLCCIKMEWYDNAGTIPSISNQKLRIEHIPFPTPTEQQAIADYLDEKCADIDSLIQTKQSKIDSLKEYKKSIIYEYVTGKREVE